MGSTVWNERFPYQTSDEKTALAFLDHLFVLLPEYFRFPLRRIDFGSTRRWLTLAAGHQEHQSEKYKPWERGWR